jgi:peptide/nickel transport system substrate-binding protein
LIRALLLSAAILAGAVPARAAPHPDLVIGVASFPSTLHPSFDPDVIKFYILGFADRPVTAYDPAWHLGCLLCTRVPTLENGDAVLEPQPDGSQGLAVTFHFKPGLTWGDGAPLGAADLAFTARIGRDPNSGFTNTHAWAKIRSVDVIDPQTAVLHFTELDYQYNAMAEILPAHLEEQIYDHASGPGAYMQQSLYNRAPLNPGLYNGPYRITAYDLGSQIVLEPNPHWSGARPAFRRIVIKTISNTAALQANLQSGDVDMVPGEGVGLTLDQVLTLQKQQPDRFAYAYKPNLTFQHIDLNLNNPILADLRVRRALLLGMDRKGIADKLLGGRVPVADSFVSPLEDIYTKEGVPTYPFDPARARALLAEAGWTPGPDGICRNAAGQKLSIEFSTTAGVRARELQQQILQSDWRKIGVETIIKNEPPRTLFGETLRHRAFTGMAMFSWSSSIESSPRQVLSSGQIPTAANNWGGTNYTGFHNAQMDHDIDAVEREMNPAKRKIIWADIQHIYAEDLPVLPMLFGSEAHVWPLWLKGVVPTGHNQPSTLHAEDWLAE